MIKASGAKFKTDKITHHGYERFYDYFLVPYMKKKCTLFEIGIDAGRSLKLWENMFPKAKIFGMDIDHEFEFKQGKIFKGDQSSLADLKRITAEVGKADIIIDDGSHLSEHQLFTFNYLFAHMLSPSGLFVIEDIETSWASKGVLYGNKLHAGYGKPNNVAEIFKDVVDIVNREFLLKKHLDFIRKKSKINFVNLQRISWVMFGANCIIIKKMSTEEYRKYGNRKYRYADEFL